MEDLDKRDLTQLLAIHLFGKLSTGPCFTIDKNCQTIEKEDLCCSKNAGCKMAGQFGDTSIGNTEVWHGKVNILIKDKVIVEVLCDGDNDTDTPIPEGKHVQLLSKSSQLVAESIVFSFLQKHMHPERENFLTPCIGVDCSSMMVMFYDSEHDILLESTKIPLMSKDHGSSTFSTEAVLVAWLVVNYNILCTGITDSMKTFKANFVSQAKDKLEIYQNNLRLRNVADSTGKNRTCINLNENFIPSQFLLDRQRKINAIQTSKLASKKVED